MLISKLMIFFAADVDVYSYVGGMALRQHVMTRELRGRFLHGHDKCPAISVVLLYCTVIDSINTHVITTTQCNKIKWYLVCFHAGT